MTEISIENINALIDKGRELKNLLTGTPEILEFLRIAESFNEEKNILPLSSDKLVRTGEAAKILCVSKGMIQQYVKEGILTPLYTAGSGHKRFWLSEVKAVAKRS